MKKMMNQKALAEACGISESHVSYIVNGKRWPSRRLAKKLERATGVSAAVWIWEPNKNPYVRRVNEGSPDTVSGE